VLRAGIYNLAESDDRTLSAQYMRPDGSGFRDTLLKVRSIGLDKVDKDNEIRKRYFLWEALGGASPPRSLTLEQKVDYSAVLVRRKKFSEAIRFLEQASREHPDNILLRSHLAHATFASGQPDSRAIQMQQELLSKRVWPEHFSDFKEEDRQFLLGIGWSEHPTDFYRKVEFYLLKLMRLRSTEPASAPFQSVDALFGGDPKKPLRFVNEQGIFEPGKLAVAERRKLPPDAREIVQQLLLWLPEDLRLYWLLGELYNADDNPASLQAAGTIFDELVFTYKLRALDLRDHRQKVLDHLKSNENAPTMGEFEKKVEEVEKKDAPARMQMNPQTIAVTFASGFFVGIFALWQFQEIRRRRRPKD
jgi:hypothetical protein